MNEPEAKKKKSKKPIVIALSVCAVLFTIPFIFLFATTGTGPSQGAGMMACLIREQLKIPCSVIDDLDYVCGVAKELKTKTFTSSEEKRQWLNDRIFAGVRTVEGIKMFKAIGFARPEDKYKLIKSVANENGAPDWSCPALEELVTSPAP